MPLGNSLSLEPTLKCSNFFFGHRCRCYLCSFYRLFCAPLYFFLVFSLIFFTPFLYTSRPLFHFSALPFFFFLFSRYLSHYLLPLPLSTFFSLSHFSCSSRPQARQVLHFPRRIRPIHEQFFRADSDFVQRLTRARGPAPHEQQTHRCAGRHCVY